MTITISDDEKIKIFDTVWAQYEPTIKDVLIRQIGQAINSEMYNGILRNEIKSRILAIANPYMEENEKVIEEKIKKGIDKYLKKASEYILKNVVQYFDDSMIDKIMDHVEKDMSKFRSVLKTKLFEFGKDNFDISEEEE